MSQIPKKVLLNYYSPARRILMAEINRHPQLCSIIKARGLDRRRDWGDIIGEVAAYCVVVMDGCYFESELERLYTILINKLQAKRSPIILH